MATLERRYQMTRVRAGSYLLPSNDAQTLWHIYSFMDGESFGLTGERDQQYWACARYRGTYEQAVFAAAQDVEDMGYISRDRWIETDTYMHTRADAIAAALKQENA